MYDGRGGGIRTRDPLHPMQVRYQAALRPDEAQIISEGLCDERRSQSFRIQCKCPPCCTLPSGISACTISSA